MTVWLLLVWLAGPYEGVSPPVFAMAFETKTKCEASGAALKDKKAEASWACSLIEVQE